MTSVLIVGGGFRGILAAAQHRAVGHAVRLVDAGKSLGGVLSPLQWGDFKLDKGCHLFGNNDPQATAIYREILNDEVSPVDVRYASVLAGQQSSGIAVPDLSSQSDEVQARVLFELLNTLDSSSHSALNLGDALRARFGATAAQLLAPSIEKVFARPLAELEREALNGSLFNRVRLFPDPLIDRLKRLEELDGRLASSPREDPFRHYPQARQAYEHRNFYPKAGSMGAFCDAALLWLQGLGVDVRLGEGIDSLDLDCATPFATTTNGERLDADLFVWTLDVGILAKLMLDDSSLLKCIHKVPMALHYFSVTEDEVADFTYVHDYEPGDMLFRFSTQGIYGRQRDALGRTFICCEVTGALDSAKWSQAESYSDALWRELQALKLVSADAPHDVFCIKTPVSYRLPAQGYAQAIARADEGLQRYGDRLQYADSLVFSKAEIVKASRIGEEPAT